jgi:hypothetical protein
LRTSALPIGAFSEYSRAINVPRCLHRANPNGVIAAAAAEVPGSKPLDAWK